tara:strand:- start:18162 stop:18731 length:570 start_codon:yes stop_codon:yes gene_type:complete
MTDENKTKWRNLGKKLAGITPVIGSMLGGPAVGAGIQILGDLLGTTDPDEIESQIEGMTHEQVIELKQHDTNVKVKELEAEMNLEDNLTARHESDNATDSKFVQYLRPLMAWVWTGVAIIVVFYGLFLLDIAKLSIFTTILSFTSTVLITIIGFYFGSRGLEKVAAITGNRFGSKAKSIKSIIDIFKRK